MPAIITDSKTNVPTFKGIDTLPKTKVKNGYLYKLMKRNKKAAIYSQEFDVVKEGRAPGVIGFEVFKVIVTKPSAIMQKHGTKAGMWYHYPETEKFPGNEDFGKSAWAYMKKDTAEAKYKELTNA